MITHLQGEMVEKTPTYVVIDCHGVGYLVHISLHTYEKISDQKQLKLYTFLQVREDSHTIFGFYQKSERDIFVHLLSVSGVGASTARVMLSSLSPAQIQQAIINGDVGTIQSVKGIGSKTAQRIILDLREKMMKMEGMTDMPDTQHSNKEEALSALEVLGYSRKVTEKIVQKILSQSAESISVENIIKQALKML